jgi:hypothetical protein
MANEMMSEEMFFMALSFCAEQCNEYASISLDVIFWRLSRGHDEPRGHGWQGFLGFGLSSGKTDGWRSEGDFRDLPKPPLEIRATSRTSRSHLWKSERPPGLPEATSGNLNDLRDLPKPPLEI